MGSWPLFGWGAGGVAVGCAIGYGLQVPPWTFAVLGALGAICGWVAGLWVQSRIERDDDGGHGPGSHGDG